MIPLDELARELRRELATTPETANLVDHVVAIERAVAEVWRDNAMIWFTDHGPAHSRRVAEYALNLARPPGVAAELRTTPLELFILFAASWLHDVGMQDLSGAGPIGGSLDHNMVRHEHPHRTYTRIEADWSSWGLPKDDNPLAEIIAYVARAHGTKYYRPTLPILDTLKSVRNQPVRGKLLACLLLMADELDLHYERVVPFSGVGQLNDISQAHFLKHRCVERVQFAYSPSGDLDFEIHLAYSSTLSEECRELVRRWIEVKLRQQMGMTEKELLEGFASQVRYNRSIRFETRVKSGFAWPQPSSTAVNVIEADVMRDYLINHAGAIASAQAGLELGGALAVIGRRLSPGESPGDVTDIGERDGQQDFVEALGACATRDGWRVLWSRRAGLGLGATAGDILQEWCIAAGVPDTDANAVDTEDVWRSSLLRRLLRQLAAAGGDRVLLVLHAAELVDPDDLSWLCEVAISELRELGTTALVLSTSPNAIPQLPGLSMVRLGVLGIDEVLDYLTRYTHYSAASAVAASNTDYRTYRNIALNFSLQRGY